MANAQLTCVNCLRPATVEVAVGYHPIMGTLWEAFCEGCAEVYAPNREYWKKIEK